MDVTWDTEKNQKNINKRHLPLSLGGLVLDDEMRIERHDEEHSTPAQDRWQTIGMAGKVLFTVYTGGGNTAYYFSPFSGCGRKEVILWRTRFTGVRLVQG
jgi:uncharacterized DUF497 family protein